MSADGTKARHLRARGLDEALVAVIAWAHANGIDAEAALRKEAMRISQEIKPA